MEDNLSDKHVNMLNGYIKSTPDEHRGIDFHERLSKAKAVAEFLKKLELQAYIN